MKTERITVILFKDSRGKEAHHILDPEKSTYSAEFPCVLLYSTKRGQVCSPFPTDSRMKGRLDDECKEHGIEFRVDTITVTIPNF